MAKKKKSFEIEMNMLSPENNIINCAKVICHAVGHSIFVKIPMEIDGNMALIIPLPPFQPT